MPDALKGPAGLRERVEDKQRYIEASRMWAGMGNGHTGPNLEYLTAVVEDAIKWLAFLGGERVVLHPVTSDSDAFFRLNAILAALDRVAGSTEETTGEAPPEASIDDFDPVDVEDIRKLLSVHGKEMKKTMMGKYLRDRSQGGISSKKVSGILQCLYSTGEWVGRRKRKRNRSQNGS